MDGAVEGGVCVRRLSWIGGKVAQKITAIGPAAFFGVRKVGCVTVNTQDHVTDEVAGSGVLVGGGVIQQSKIFVTGVLSGSRLLGGDGSKGDTCSDPRKSHSTEG